jgi:hypothetical protein
LDLDLGSILIDNSFFLRGVLRHGSSKVFLLIN